MITTDVQRCNVEPWQQKNKNKICIITTEEQRCKFEQSQQKNKEVTLNNQARRVTLNNDNRRRKL